MEPQILLITLIAVGTVTALNCYRETDKGSKPLDLALHFGSEPNVKLRTKRDVPSSTAALEFDLGQYLFNSNVDSRAVDSDKFSISFWVYLEGGQPSGATIFSLKNTCFLYSPWYFRLYPASVDSGMKSTLKFTIEDVYRQRKFISLEEYQHHTWFQLTVVNSVEQLMMYVNGARVATGEGMAWKEFAETNCLRLELGRKDSRGFRGKISNLAISHTALSSRQVKQLHADIPIATSTLWLKDSFSGGSSNWTSENPPTSVTQFVNQKKPQTVSAPACGKTVCDDPSIATAYANDFALKNTKTVKLEIMVMANSDGSNQAVDAEDIKKATDAIAEAFHLSSINFQFETKVVRNSTLRKAFIMADCWSSMIGDGKCDDSRNEREQCNFPATNYDGGDCLVSPGNGKCNRTLLNNGKCDPECNYWNYDYDYGSCCSDAMDNCVDPSSPHRRYLHVTELKDIIPPADDKLRIMVVNWMNVQMLGFASMPWTRNAEMFFGSAMVDTSTFKDPFSYDTLIHELGHVLGLWHVHHGVSEIHDCSDSCLETEASLVLGDLCADTAPTYQHTECADPVVNLEQEPCPIASAVRNTPFDNHMSYSNGSCSHEKSFTPQQVARMHCYLDLVHHNSLTDKKPAAVPLPPQVLYTDTDSVTLSWLPPLNPGHNRPVCHKCDQQQRLKQYAKSATFTEADFLDLSLKEQFGPEHATDAPDSASCKQTAEAWIPTEYYFGLNRCALGFCQFNFTFDHAVRPQSIRVWIPWFASIGAQRSPVLSLQLVSVEGTVVKDLKEVHIQCDKPFTKTFSNINHLVNKVVVNTDTPHLAFDAVELTSAPSAEACGGCHSLKYKVERDPPLSSPAIVTETLYEDKSVEADVAYNYTITTLVGHVNGVTASLFHYVHNHEFCGNGILNGDEECDDGNISNGDGCDSVCQIEDGHVCMGMPSICWADTEIEERHCSFKFTNEEDGCGYYVPPGYTDQWASSVTAIGKHLTCSSTHLLLGPPPPGLRCKSAFSELSRPLWLPCQLMNNYRNVESYQLKLGFERSVVITAVIVHIGTDDSHWMSSSSSRHIYISHITEDGEQETIGVLYHVNCQNNPLILSVLHNLSKPFRRTKEVVLKISSRSIAVAAVRVRTFANFDPVTLGTCTGNLYNMVSDSCVQPSASAKTCPVLDVEHGNISCTGVAEGDSCTAFCDLGYETNTVSGSSTCSGGRWTPPLSCNIVKCNKPEVPLGYASCPDGHHFGSVCEIACNPPAHLRGNGTLIKCVESGVWTEARAGCAPICSDLTQLNAQVEDNSCIGPQEVGKKCRMECSTGYYLKGYDQKTRIDKAVCTETGKWSRQCVRIECENIHPVWNGLYNCSDNTNSLSVCHATCPSTQVKSSIQCLATGRWNASFTPCEASAVSCPSIMGTNSEISFNCTGSTAGSMCRAVCVNSSLSLYYGNNKHKSFFRDKLHCTNGGNWTTQPANLSCHTLCTEATMNDGWCDPDNNRLECQWDGGDCCLQSTKTTTVQPFPESCGSECSCKASHILNPHVIPLNGRHLERDGYVVDRRRPL